MEKSRKDRIWVTIYDLTFLHNKPQRVFTQRTFMTIYEVNYPTMNPAPVCLLASFPLLAPRRWLPVGDKWRGGEDERDAAAVEALSIRLCLRRRRSCPPLSPSLSLSLPPAARAASTPSPPKHERRGVRAELADAHVPRHRGSRAAGSGHPGLRVRLHRLYPPEPDANPGPDPEPARQPGPLALCLSTGSRQEARLAAASRSIMSASRGR